MQDRDTQRSRSVQVGILMKAYREAFPTEKGSRGLTQEELLRRMATVDSQFADRSSHTMVSRWESGVTRPNQKRLEVFGEALNLSSAEVDGLMTLAGFRPNNGSPPEQTRANVEPASSRKIQPEPPSSQSESPPPLSIIASLGMIEALRFGVVSCILPGLCIVASGYLLSAAGLMDPWIPIVYIVSIMGSMLVYRFLRMRGPHSLREFLAISLFFLLSVQLLPSALTRMDIYGFYALGQFAGKPLPFMLALMVNLMISSAAELLFHMLWNWQYGSGRGSPDPLRRAVIVVGPPVGLTYLCVLILSNIGVWTEFGIQLAALSGVFVVLLLLRDPEVEIPERDRRFFLYSAVAVAIATAAIGAVAMLAIYLAPGLPAILPDHNLLYSWEIDFDALGYPAEEALDRLNVGYLWQNMCIYVYMVLVVGGSLIADLCRLNYRSTTAAETSAVGSPTETARD